VSVAPLARHRLVAVVRNDDAGAARAIARACMAGGLRLVEITLTTPDATTLIADLVAEGGKDVIVGAGTVVTVDQVRAVVDAGAAFMVSPVTDPAVMAAARSAGVPLIPGAATPSEVARAAQLGAPAVKIFPASCLGLPFLRSVRAVLPDVPLLASGGIGVVDVASWLEAGALAVAIGSDLDAAYARDGADAVVQLAAAAVIAAGAPQPPAPHHAVTVPS
jgi:2-dehydro-3-deoxyphosphogluconate aldolase / (4S)-4-hydroxy-2-oxoglutarate aldolase